MREDLQARLDAVRARLERGYELTPEEKKEILKNRALELAREPEQKEKVFNGWQRLI